VTQALAEQDRARSSIRATVARHGARLRDATPTGMVAALVIAACMPVVWPLVKVPESITAGVALLGATGSGYISEFLKDVIDRLRRRDGAPRSQEQLQQALEQELLACLQAHDERAALARADAAALLERVHGVQAALEAASADVQLALTDAFTELGGEFAEFAWMLDETRHTLAAIEREQARQGAEQRHHTDLLHEFRVKLNLALRRLEALTAPTPDASSISVAEDERCPYMGLTPFQAEDAQWFFGRERLVAELLVRLSETPLLAVVGPSGSGKSSALRAGLLPAVRDGALPGTDVWTTIVLTLGAHPLEELAARLGDQCKVAAGQLLDDLETKPDRLRLAVRQALVGAPPGARLLLLVDQFEEVFTLCRDETERRKFIHALIGLAGEADGQGIVVLGIRADFYSRCAEYPELVGLIQDHQVVVGPMTGPELRCAITAPAARAGVVLEPGLVETVLADLGAEPGSLPLLSHALFATWQRRQDSMLTINGYRDAGGVRQAIGQTAQTAYDRLDPAHQVIAKDVFLRLTALGEGTADTRRRAHWVELFAGRDPEAVQLVLDRLTEARLITLDEDSVQVAHEALIREWPTLRGWLNEDREGLRLHRRLTEACAEWEALDRDPGALYRSGRLAATREWAASHEERLNDLEREFLVASAEREHDELVTARQRNRRLRALAGALAVLLIVTGTVSVMAVRSRQTAQQRGTLATVRQLAAQAVANLDQRPLSLLLSLESLDLAPTDETRATARDSLLQGLLTPPPSRAVLTGHTNTILGAAFSPDGNTLASAGGDGTVRLWQPATGQQIGQLTGHTGPVAAVTFSPDGTTIMSAGWDRTIRQWNVGTRQQIGEPLTLTRGVYWAGFSPDGAMIATIGEGERTVQVWDTATGNPIGQPLTGHTDTVGSVAFSPDGTIIATASDDQTVRRWDAHTGIPIGQPLTSHTGGAWGVAFSPDGTTIATSGADNTVQLWDTAMDQPIGRPLPGRIGLALRVAFSPDGTTVAAGQVDGTVLLWDVHTRTLLGPPLRGHTDLIMGLAFSPDSKTLVTASRERTLRFWNIAPTSLGQSLTGHTETVNWVAFSPDGTTIATASNDATVRRWDAHTGQPIGQPLTGHTAPVNGVAFSPDGTTIATASGDQSVRLWDAITGEPFGQQPLTGHTAPVNGVAFSPDGTIIATASNDGTVRRWDAHTGQPIGRPLTGHTAPIGGVAFSPDGTTIATASNDGTVRRWDAHSGRPIGQPLTGHTDIVLGVAFSPDGTTIATASFDGTVRRWDAHTGQPIGRPLSGHFGLVIGVAFSPDGKTIASTSDDQTVRLWNAATSAPIGQPLSGHTDVVIGVAFSPDGQTLATASQDRTVRLWPVTVEGWIRHACAVAGRNLTRGEWDEFVGADRPYVRTCPDLPSGDGTPANAPPATYDLG
jgi:WD40 repeat protein